MVSTRLICLVVGLSFLGTSAIASGQPPGGNSPGTGITKLPAVSSEVLEPNQFVPMNLAAQAQFEVESQPNLTEEALIEDGADPFASFLGVGAVAGGSLQASTPYMIGDGTVGGCGSISFLPNSFINVEHPTFSCIRASIAENNSPLPRDRLYARFNHFENITTTSFFPTSRPPESSTANLPIERFTLGMEKTFFDGRFSLEGRFPFSYQLSSDLYIARSAEVPGDPLPGSVVADNLPLDAMAWEIENFTFIAKYLVNQTPTTAFSVGLALNVPTADDVDIAIHMDDPAFPVEILPGIPLFTVPAMLDVQASVKNEIFNLSPYMAGLWTPNETWFAQGFLQFDFPLNTANAVGVGSGSVNGVALDIFDTTIEGPEKLQQQTLMRVSGGLGRWFFKGRNSQFIHSMAYLLELHYTTTLNDAKLISFDVPIPIPLIDADINIGNLANRNDILHLTNGVAMEIGDEKLLSAGLVLPLKQGSDKFFDFELNVYLTQKY